MISWEEQYQKGEGLRWWPDVNLIRYIARTYPVVRDRSTIEVLEIGCGTGANLFGLGEEGFYRTTGLDISAEALSLTEDYVQSKGWKPNLLLSSILDLDTEDQAYDLILDIQCVQHLSADDHARAYHIISDILKPAGRLFSVHLAPGTDYAALYPTTPGVWLCTLPELYGAMAGSLVIERVETTARSSAGRWVIAWVIEAKKP